MRRTVAHFRFPLAAVTFLCAGACAPVAGAQDPTAYGEPREVAEVTDPRLSEVSGIVASRRNKDVYFTHNDSGGQPEIYALDRSGRVVAVVRVDNAQNVDWEDIAVAPGEQAGTFDICVADIGDNGAERREIVIYRFPEPTLPPTSVVPVRVHATAYRLRYADGPQNAEAFIVHPTTGDGYVLTKRRDGVARVYKIPAPWQPDKIVTLTAIAELKFPDAMPLMKIVTAADISADGERLATRGYLCGWEWALPKGADADAFERIFVQNPIRIELAGEPQGEALCYTADGQAVLTISEQSPTALFEARRIDAPSPRSP